MTARNAAAKTATAVNAHAALIVANAATAAIMKIAATAASPITTVHAATATITAILITATDVAGKGEERMLQRIPRAL